MDDALARALENYAYSEADGRRVPLEERQKQNTLVTIQDKHREIVRLSLLGLSHKEIAERVGMTTQAISICLNSPIVIELRKALQQKEDERVLETRRALTNLLPEVTEIYKKLLQEGAPVTAMEQFKVAGDILDRTGIIKEKGVQTKSVSTHITTADLVNLRKELNDEAITIPSNEVEELI